MNWLHDSCRGVIVKQHGTGQCSASIEKVEVSCAEQGLINGVSLKIEPNLMFGTER